MRIDRQIKILCAKSDITNSEIARRLGKTPQAFQQKLKRGRLSVEDLNEIALVTGCQFECKYVLLDGTTIDLN